MIVAYITSHGFGHCVRACEALRGVPLDIPITLRTRVPEWFIKTRLDRPFALTPAEFDCGTLGPDSRRIDLRLTLEAIEPILDANDARLNSEAQWLREIGARLVVSDVPPFPLAAARLAGVPSILVANFTWSAIYEYLIRDEGTSGVPTPERALHAAATTSAQRSSDLIQRMRRVIGRLDAHYAQGDLLLIPALEIPMRACRCQRKVGYIARRGTPRREALSRALNLDPSRPIYLVYLGREGFADMHWENRERLAGLQMVGYAPPPDMDGLIHPLPESVLSHADAAASVDAVIGKAGYGICGECVATGTPVMYPPRPGFAEMLAVDRDMAHWGGGLCISERDFLELQWQPHLDRLAGMRQPPEAISCSGASECAAAYADAWRKGKITMDET